jgi:hypothetical protein
MASILDEEDLPDELVKTIEFDSVVMSIPQTSSDKTMTIPAEIRASIPISAITPLENILSNL